MPLYIFLRKSLDEGVIPEELLQSIICPVHKGGSRAEQKQFRPVALTSHIIKVFERVVRNSLVEYLEKNSYMSAGQHDLNCNEHCGVDSIHLDFSKAFDKVDHGVLFHNLNELGVRGKLGIWIATFLKNRFQMVAVNRAKSEKSLVVSGIPQGTVLGPVLFLVLIGDIADGTSPMTRVTSFADDTRGSRKIKKQENTEILQEDLKVIYKWAENANIAFNDDKFEVVRFWPS